MCWQEKLIVPLVLEKSKFFTNHKESAAETMEEVVMATVDAGLSRAQDALKKGYVSGHPWTLQPSRELWTALHYLYKM
jgi:hypothetical protein